MSKSLFYSLLVLYIISTSSILCAETYTKIDIHKLKEYSRLNDYYIIDTRDVPIAAKGYISNSLIIPNSMFKWLSSCVPPSGKIVIISEKNNYEATMKRYMSTNYEIIGYALYDEVIQYSFFNIEKIEYDPNTYESITNIVKNKGNIIDIREIKEYKETGVIKEALLIPMSTFMKNQSYKKIPTTGNVYVYCYGGTRAVVAMSFIKRAGYTNKFYIMKLGIFNVIQENYPLVPYSS